jgi:opacity protein-like surface antigen
MYIWILLTNPIKMNKKFLICCIIVLTAFTAHSQNSKFGVKAGFNNLTIKASASDENTISDDGSGFYVGLFTDINLDDKLSIQPELQFTLASQDGESVKSLALPIMLKYQVASKFSLLVGPQLEYLLEEETELINEFGIGLGAGLSFDITEKLFADGRYVFGLSNRFNDDLVPDEDVKLKFNYIQVGLGYKF